MPICTPKGRDCYTDDNEVDYSSCWIECKGLYADVHFVNTTISETRKDFLEELVHAYNSYKESQIESLVLMYDKHAPYRKRYRAEKNPYSSLRVIQVYFDTATYDEIAKDVSVTLADQLGVIGGTMGLFAGFSFLSALEIVYFVMKHLISVLRSKLHKIR